jgi:2-isopropylmalate synthase
VGNLRRVLISEMAGRSSLLAKLELRYPELREPAVAAAVLHEVQELEHQGYSFEAADGSFDLLVRRQLGQLQPAFDLKYYRVHGIGTAARFASRSLPPAQDEAVPGSGVPGSAAPGSGSRNGEDTVEATVKLDVRGRPRLCVAEGNGPVDALRHALRQALEGVFPVLQRMTLTDYKVRVVNSADGTGARVRVLIEHEIDRRRFSTIGVHANIIEASWQALVDAIDYAVATSS